MNETWYAGLDAHSSISSVVILDEDGEVVYEKDGFRTCEKQLQKHLSHSGKNVIVHLEASTIHEFVGDLIEEEVQEVIASDPRQNDLISSTGGGDLEEAYQLARLLRLDEYQPVHRETDNSKRVYREAFLEYLRVNQDQARLKQSTQMLFQKWGLHESGPTKLDSPHKRARILDRVDEQHLKSILNDRFDELSMLIDKKKKAKKRVKLLEERFPVIQEYRKMPGGGFYTSNGFVAKILNPFRFGTRKQLYKYAKLAVKESESANEKKGGAHLNPAGHGLLKNVFFRVFIGARSTKERNGYSRFYEVSLSKSCNDSTDARLNTARKICDVMWSMWKNGTAYDDDQVRHPDDPLGS